MGRISPDIVLSKTDVTRHDADLRRIVSAVPRLLEEMGVPVQPSGRVATALRLAKEGIENPERMLGKPQEFRPSQQAVVDLMMLGFALRHLSGRQQWKATIQKSLGGKAVPWEDKDQLARNTEFELYIAALLRAGGCAVFPEEPDVRAVFRGWQLSFASKRLSSKAKLLERVKEGMDQIAKMKRPGIVAVDISVMAIERGNFIATADIEVGQALAEKATEAAMIEVERQVWGRRDDALHLGVLFLAVVPVILIERGAAVHALCMERRWGLFPEQHARPGRPLARLSQCIAQVPIF